MLRKRMSLGLPPRALHQRKHHDLSRTVQSYISTSNDPYFNLSFEHHLLTNSSPDSKVLFIYTNRPSVILGRNQNPWLELNLAYCLEQQRAGALDIVRRRSGGGTVFHDLGNVCWTVICPQGIFTRDKHADMVTRALRSPVCGVARARVNERHDIVLDQAEERNEQVRDPEDMHVTPWTRSAEDVIQGLGLTPLKVSGSAYKLTKHRALHHGTCLLHSENLGHMGECLHSPAKGFIQAKGVESVSSPVGNAGISHDAFTAAVRHEFLQVYEVGGRVLEHDEVSEAVLQDALDLRKGFQELKEPAWIFAQTPQFSFDFTLAQGQHVAGLTAPLHIHIDVQKACITSFSLSTSRSTREGSIVSKLGRESTSLIGTSLLEHSRWETLMKNITLPLSSTVRDRLIEVLDKKLPGTKLYESGCCEESRRS